MPFYAIPAYPIYTPQVVYSTPYTTLAHSLLTAHEEVHEMLQAEVAHRQYLAHVEEQRMLAQFRQREALRRQAEYRQREALAALNRRRFSPVTFASPHIRRQIVVRPESAPVSIVPDDPKVEDYLGNALVELLGLRDEDEAARMKAEDARLEQAALEAHRAAIKEAKRAAAMEEARKAAAVEQAKKVAAAEQAKKVAAAKARRAAETDRLRRAAIHNARLSFVAKLEALYDELHSTSPPQDSNSAESPKIPVQAPAPAPSPAPDATENQASDSARVSRDRAARVIQGRWRSRSADRTAFKDAMNSITLLRDRFEFLKRTFNLPEHLEFRELSEGQTAVPALLFTSANASVHTYINELTKLLMLADSIPSAGRRQIREIRRSFVKMVEKALDDVETMVADVFERHHAASRPTTPPAAGTGTEEKTVQQSEKATGMQGAVKIKTETGDVQDTVGIQHSDSVEEQSGSEPVAVEGVPTVDSIPTRIEIETPSQVVDTPESSVPEPKATNADVKALSLGPAVVIEPDSSNVELVEEKDVPKVISIPTEALVTDEKHPTPHEEVFVPVQVVSQDAAIDTVPPVLSEHEPQAIETLSEPVTPNADLDSSVTLGNVITSGLHLSEALFPTDIEAHPKPTSPVSDSFDIVYPDSPLPNTRPLDSEVAQMQLPSATPKDDDEASEQDATSSTTSLGEEEDFEVV